jgi:hypothetical protein
MMTLSTSTTHLVTHASGSIRRATSLPIGLSFPAAVSAYCACRHLTPPDDPAIPPVGTGPSHPWGSSEFLARAYLCMAAPNATRTSSSVRIRSSATRTPPADSIREILIVASGHVSQCIVGKGVPSSRIGGTSITMGSPRWQRRVTGTRDRGGRPIWTATTSRSSIVREVIPCDEIPDHLQHRSVI